MKFLILTFMLVLFAGAANANTRHLVCNRFDDSYAQYAEYDQDLPDSSEADLSKCKSDSLHCGYVLGGSDRKPLFATQDGRYTVNLAVSKDYAIVDMQVVDIKKGVGFSQYDSLRVEEGSSYAIFIQQYDVSSALITCEVQKR